MILNAHKIAHFIKQLPECELVLELKTALSACIIMIVACQSNPAASAALPSTAPVDQAFPNAEIEMHYLESEESIRYQASGVLGGGRQVQRDVIGESSAACSSLRCTS